MRIFALMPLCSDPKRAGTRRADGLFRRESAIIDSMKFFLFDLDGTLTDPQEGITGCVQYALEQFGIREERASLKKFIGPPLKTSFMQFYGFSEAEAERASAFYRARFAPIGVYENAPYDGIEAVLSGLKRSGAVLAVASSKPVVFVRQILERFSLIRYFDAVIGAEEDGSHGEKAEVIARAMEDIGAERDQTAMVGDRKYDILGAKANGIYAVGAAYGFAEEGELAAAGADEIAETVSELGRILNLLHRNHT